MSFNSKTSFTNQKNKLSNTSTAILNASKTISNASLINKDLTFCFAKDCCVSVVLLNIKTSEDRIHYLPLYYDSRQNHKHFNNNVYYLRNNQTFEFFNNKCLEVNFLYFVVYVNKNM